MKISRLPFYKNPLIIVFSIFIMFVLTAVFIFLLETEKIKFPATAFYYFVIAWLLFNILYFFQFLYSKLKKEEKTAFINLTPKTKLKKVKEKGRKVMWTSGIITAIIHFSVTYYYSNHFLGSFYASHTLSKISLIWIPLIIIVSFLSTINRFYTKEEIVSIELHPQKIVFFKEKGAFYEFDKNEIENLNFKNNSIEISYVERKLNKQISFTTKYFEEHELNPLFENLNLIK